MRTSLLILLLTVAISVAVPASKLYAYGGGSGHGTLGDRQESSIGERAGFLLMNDLPLGIGCGWGVGVVGHPGTVGAGVNPPDAPEYGNKNIDRDVLEFVMLLVAIDAGAYPTGDIIVSDEAIDKLDELFGDKEEDKTQSGAVQSGSTPANTRQEYPGITFRVDQVNQDTKKFSGVTQHERITVIERKLPNGTILTEREHQPRDLLLPNQIEHIKQWTDVHSPTMENLTYQKGDQYIHVMKWQNGQTFIAERFPDRVEYTYEYPEKFPEKCNNKPVKEVLEIKTRDKYKYSQTITYTDGTKETRESDKPFGRHPISLNDQLESMRKK